MGVPAASFSLPPLAPQNCAPGTLLHPWPEAGDWVCFLGSGVDVQACFPFSPQAPLPRLPRDPGCGPQPCLLLILAICHQQSIASETLPLLPA